MNGPGNGNGDDLPEPVIEPIRNFADLPEPVKNEITDGALLTLRGGGPHANAINVNVLSGVLVHFDRLFRILRRELRLAAPVGGTRGRACRGRPRSVGVSDASSVGGRDSAS